jgi:hypothetical protein
MLDPIALRRRRAADGLKKWRQSELQRCAEDLRSRDTLAGAITDMVQRGKITEASAWGSLAAAYDRYSALEHRFEKLLMGSDRDALEVYRAR